MKKLLSLLAVLVLITALVFCLASCGDDKDQPDDTSAEDITVADDTTSADEQTTAAEDQTTAEETTVEETTEGETLPPVLEWEPYDEKATSVVVVSEDHKVDPTQWVVTDNLGRTAATNTDVGAVKEDKIIAMFYWTWHGNFANNTKPYNVQEILDSYDDEEEAVNDLWAGKYSPANAYHFWDEPIWGYYHGNDEWVIRKQCELLAAAGVDVVFFDNTNGSYTWMDTALAVMKVFSQAMEEGVDAPKVSFMLPFGATDGARQQIGELYRNIYEKELYPETWFYMDDKPMLMGYAGACPDNTTKEFFSFRANNAGYSVAQPAKGSNQWGWLSVFPQTLYYKKDGTLEQTTVGVSMNYNTVTGATPYPMNHPNAMGRTYTTHGIDGRPDALLYGACFAEQFDNAIAADPEIVFVTGWNEWVAMRLTTWSGTSYTKAFVDEYNDEFSRDLEPSAGALKDNYYYELVDYARKFAGANQIEVASGAKLIDVNGGYGQWENVTPAYNDYFGMTNRDHAGYVGTHYTNDTARNDIYDAKVARDYENIYFMVRTVDDLTPYTDDFWMRLYIDTDSQNKSSWETFEYIINRTSPESETVTTLEKFTGKGFETEVVCKVDYSVKGNVMMIKVPKSALGIEGYDFTFNFKWTDNTQENGNIMEWYNNGDVAPIGRFKFCYTTKAFDAYQAPETYIAGYSYADLSDQKTCEDVIFATEGLDYQLSADGTVFTAKSGDTKSFTLSYAKSSPKPTVTRFPYVKVTYTAANSTATAAVKVAPAAGAYTIDKIKGGVDDEIVCDGQEHTLLVYVGKSTMAKNGGYYNGLRLSFTGFDGEITVKSVQLVTAEEAERK